MYSLLNQHLSIMKFTKKMWPVIFLFFSFVYGFAESTSDLIKEIRSKQEAFTQYIKDIYLHQEAVNYVTLDKLTKEIKVEIRIYQMGEKYRTEYVPVEGGTSKDQTMIFDGKCYYLISSGLKKKASEEEQEIIAKNIQQEWINVLSAQYYISGIEKYQGNDCYVLELNENKKNSIKKMWIDKNDLYSRKIEASGKNGEKIEFYFSDFRPIADNFKIPFKAEVYQNSKRIYSSIVKDFKVNSDIPEKLFDPDREPDFNLLKALRSLFE